MDSMNKPISRTISTGNMIRDNFHRYNNKHKETVNILLVRETNGTIKTKCSPLKIRMIITTTKIGKWKPRASMEKIRLDPI
jgi:hypothetical protein